MIVNFVGSTLAKFQNIKITKTTHEAFVGGICVSTNLNAPKEVVTFNFDTFTAKFVSPNCRLVINNIPVDNDKNKTTYICLSEDEIITFLNNNCHDTARNVEFTDIGFEIFVTENVSLLITELCK